MVTMPAWVFVMILGLSASAASHPHAPAVMVRKVGHSVKVTSRKAGCIVARCAPPQKKIPTVTKETKDEESK